MKRSALVLAALLACALPAFADAPATRWLRFAVGFEPGEAGLPGARENAYGPGRVGRALRLGEVGGSPGFRGVVDLARPGAITGWVKPSRWLAPSPEADYVPVIRVLGRGRAVLVVERDRRYPGRPHDSWIAGFFTLARRGNAMLQRDLPKAWDESAWHFLAFQWDATGFSLRIDGGPEARFAAPVSELAREFPETESTLVIGGGSREGLWVDEFAVWSRALSERELAALRLRPGGAAKRP